ncbi:hypothetical protein CC86DRAFT_372865 [Ophiobolus disseminans]|uniref:Uncharacterized protein n=1 Tax=Ophiobolus disseminans TaxID=1469910 RepID=A0A6A6ZPY2_9PLEO|nr:hypothetical protein CC86DRAFT_372865 [Ophiobolus disseminans]
MKVAAATTLLFAALALASPAPVAQPNAIAHPAEILAARDPSPSLQERAKKPKPNSGGNDSNSTGAADTLTANRVLQLGALSLGVMEIVRLW